MHCKLLRLHDQAHYRADVTMIVWDWVDSPAIASPNFNIRRKIKKVLDWNVEL
jgi:hypothetical protein